MPEGDTVWLACRRLHAALAGRVLTRCEFRVPQLATTDFTGVEVREVVSRGKHQLFRFGNGWTLHTHLRMDGGLADLPGRAGSGRGGPAFQIRVVMANADYAAIGYRLPVVEMVRTDAEDGVVGHLGPDLLGPDWSLHEALRRLRADPDRTIGEALLDQRNLAGIGTLYRAETAVPAGGAPADPGRPGARPRTGRDPGQAAAGEQQADQRPGHHGRPPGRRQALGLRAAGTSLPALRHGDRDRGVRPGRAGAAQLLVPALPAAGLNLTSRALQPSLA